MTPANRMESLGSQIVEETTGADFDLTEFASSSVMLDVRRGSRTFVMAYSPQTGFGVDELGPGDGFLTGYRHSFSDFEAAASRLRELVQGIGTDNHQATLNLVVIAARDLEATKEFYGLLGLDFSSEQHGSGPRHYAASSGSTTFEIYPSDEAELRNPVRIGFQVSVVDHTIETFLRAGAKIVSMPKDSPWGRRAVVEDPEGNRVELAQPIRANTA